MPDLGCYKVTTDLLANWLIIVVIKVRVAFPERALEVRVSRDLSSAQVLSIRFWEEVLGGSGLGCGGEVP